MANHNDHKSQFKIVEQLLLFIRFSYFLLSSEMLHHNPVAEHIFQQGNKAVVQRRNHSSLKMPAPGGGSLPLYPRCACCPFGYHIDLDFINYCQSLGTVDPSPGQKLRRDRRRQRQSMEIMLGLGPMFQQTDTLQMLPKVGEVRYYFLMLR